MGIGYVRSTKVLKKICSECHTLWDDEQILADVQHGYGGDTCPFCHANWELTEIRKIPKLISKPNRDTFQ
jgi:hypothetical protein